MFSHISVLSLTSVVVSILVLVHTAFASISGVTKESCLTEQHLSVIAIPNHGDDTPSRELHPYKGVHWTAWASSLPSIEIDLGKRENICFIDIEWQNGQKSIPLKVSASFFSDTGFKEILSAESAKTTMGFDRIYFQDLDARFLKITFLRGKSLDDLTEIHVYAPGLPLYDNFQNESKTNDKWEVVYTGHGFTGTKKEKGNDSVYQIYPKTSKLKKETHASLVVSRQNFSNFKWVADVRTDGQLRKNNPPNSWEAGWIFFRYTDTFHYYWFTLKPNGIELGKKDCDNCVDPVEGQIILFTGPGPRLKIGEWSKWTVEAVNNHIMISVDGKRVIDFTDDNMSNDLSKGQVAMYSEDAKVSFDNFYLLQY